LYALLAYAPIVGVMDQTSLTSLATVLVWVYGIGTLVSVVGQIVIVVIITGVVRRHRPDAYGTLLAWASASLGANLLFTIAGFVGRLVAVRGSTASMVTFQIVTLGIHIPVTIALFAVLALGLSRLAKPPVEPVGRGEPPYR
jgi:hypothetical protein